MRLVEDSLLAQHIRQPHHTTRPQNRAANKPTSIRQWRYRPYLLNEEPIEIETEITVNFVLSGS